MCESKYVNLWLGIFMVEKLLGCLALLFIGKTLLLA